MAKKLGTVTWFNEDKGIGVIRCEDADFFAHYSEVIPPSRKRKVLVESSLGTNARVSFVVSQETHLELKIALQISVIK